MEPEKNISHRSDKELFDLLVQSDKNALATIYDRYSIDLYAYIMSLVRTRASGRQAQEDTIKILIDVFLSLWGDRETLLISSTLKDYLVSSAYSRAFNYMSHTRKDITRKFSPLIHNGLKRRKGRDASS